MQAEELRRIERDLHDGAQARLVSLSMLVGRAEAQLDDRPEVAELVRAARDEAGAAIRELRDLARGIAPPVLADRGLVAAVESLAARSPMPVDVERAPARAPRARRRDRRLLRRRRGADEHRQARRRRARDGHARATGRRRCASRSPTRGPGGADAAAGSGLAGLRSRVAALDGTLDVTSSAAGTTIVAELPCGS